MADDGDLLSYLSNNWQQILGIPPSAPQGYGGGMTPAAPPPVATPPAGYFGGGAQPSFSPSGAVDAPNWGPNPNSPDAQAAALGIPPSAVVPPPNYTAGPPQGGPLAGAPMPPPPGGPSSANAAPGMLPPPGAGMPPPNGAMPPPGPPAAPGYGPSGPSIPTSTGPTPAGPPMQIAPQAPPAPPLSGNGPQFSTNGGNLAAALGIQQRPAWQNMLTNGLAGLGKGLSAVGNMKPGTPGLQAFAAGAGGGLTGGLDEADKQKQQQFINTSRAFQDMMAAKRSDDQTALYRAHSNYFTARAQQMMTPGAGGSKAYQNDPFWKTMKVEDFSRKYEHDQQQILQKKWAMNGTPPDEQQEDLKNLQKQTDQYRKRLYQTAGVDPDQAEKFRTMGATADNPFDTKSMTLDQFNATVPMGAWFKDQNGVVRQRTVGPPTSDSGAPAAGNGQQAANDDYLASQEEPAA